MGSRWYLQPEPILRDPRWQVEFAYMGHSLPAYSYALNNPLHFVDDKGDTPRVFWDLFKNWNELRQSGRGSYDKFFHCKANCEASTRGGFDMLSDRADVQTLTDWREWAQEKLGNEPKSDCDADSAANDHGRKAPVGANCRSWCSKYPHPPSYDPPTLGTASFR